MFTPVNPSFTGVRGCKLQGHVILMLNIETPRNFAVNTLKQYKRFYHGVIPAKDADVKANNEDHDQTAPPLGAV